MKATGSLLTWHDDRGFGFIKPDQGGQNIFVHISAFPKDGTRPAVGEKLIFEVTTGPNGKKRLKTCNALSEKQRRHAFGHNRIKNPALATCCGSCSL